MNFTALLSAPLDCILALLLLPTFAWDLITGFTGLTSYALLNAKEEREETEQEQQSVAWLALKFVLALLVVPSLVMDILTFIGRAIAGIVLALVSFDVNLRLNPKLGFKSGCISKQELEAMAPPPS